MEKYKIYRSVLNDKALVNKLIKTNRFVRPPVKIPFVVDNLWEWKRSEKFPSRRFSAFASPQAHLAKKQGPSEGNVYRVELVGRYKICQLKGYRNAVRHPDCITLPILLFEKIGNDWLSSSMDAKLTLGRLWLPALTKEEVEQIFNQVPFFVEHRELIHDSIRFWDDVQVIDDQHPVIDDESELFFEAIDGYYLRPFEE
jgi:hypothetical protein